MSEKPSLNILFVSQVPNTRLMGVPRVMYCVGDYLQSQGHQVDYFFEEDGVKPWFNKVALIEWAMRNAGKIGELAKAKKYDAIVITTVSGWALSTFRDQLLPKNTRIISWHHGLEALMWKQMMAEEATGNIKFSPQFKLYYGGILLWALTQSFNTQDASWFTSTEEQTYVRGKYPHLKNTAYFVPNGVEDIYYYPERFDKPFNNDTPPNILFVGYWDPWRKGRTYLVDAFTRLHDKHPEVTLTLAGVRVDTEQILNDFPEDCRDKITVIESAKEAELIELYKSHDIFCLPALFEGMPLVLLEAMACGLPSVTTANNGMKDLIRHEENGLLIPRRDSDALLHCLTVLVENPELRSKLGYQAYQDVKNGYTWDHTGAICEQSLLEVTGHAQPSAYEKTTVTL